MEVHEIEKIKKIAITAMFSDDTLMEMFVLKGGNAISLIYPEFSRASVDLDISMKADIDQNDLSLIGEKIGKVLETTFSKNGYKVFDFKFSVRPSEPKEGAKYFWGGYRAEFKLIEKEHFNDKDIDTMRNIALSLGEGAKKAFIIDISKYEYCDRKRAEDIDGLTVYVYTPEMIVIEKIRAICQQMPDYPYGNKSGRARDFYDFYILMKKYKINLLNEKNLELLRLIFKAKEVPLNLINKIPEYKEFHEKDFPSVTATIKQNQKIESFDYYFNYLVGKTRELKILWEV